MWIVLAKHETILLSLVIFASLACFSHCDHMNYMACSASSIKSCPAFLYFAPKKPISIIEVTSLFHVSSSSVNETGGGFVIAITCGCPDYDTEYALHLEYMVQRGDTWKVISSKFGSLMVEKPDKALIPTLNITLDIVCGCSTNMELLTYIVQTEDTLFTICSRFGAELKETVNFNNVKNQDMIFPGQILYIPGPGGIRNVTAPKDLKTKKNAKALVLIIVGTVVSAIALALLLVIFIFWRGKGIRPSKIYIIKGLFRDISSMPSNTKTEESIIVSVSSDRATDFPYSEVCNATSNFSLSRKIGQGSYGSVYLGKLRGNDVAIKQMKNTKSREFLSEINILCNVHHMNLIQLIGYAAGGESLFLVYEFAQNGALSDHLHNPSVRGYEPLPWATRVQIALDAAQGLEYIHVHIKPYYVHRDVKSSNILLDAKFRAKIADFGLVKLLEQSTEAGNEASRLVGTFGYLAPEYVRDGCLTAKSDVYAFGVVLMELLTGQPALISDAGSMFIQYGEHRSLVESMLSALGNKDPLAELTKHIDPNLSHYHKDSLLQMAFLSKDCVNDDWNRRPDMSRVVLYLSQIVVRTKEWQKLA